MNLRFHNLHKKKVNFKIYVKYQNKKIQHIKEMFKHYKINYKNY